jgi:hypothetical protein
MRATVVRAFWCAEYALGGEASVGCKRTRMGGRRVEVLAGREARGGMTSDFEMGRGGCDEGEWYSGSALELGPVQCAGDQLWHRRL